MVQEKRFVLGIDDISGVLYMCRKCEEEITLRLGGVAKVPHNCPICNTEWMDIYKKDSEKPEALLLAVLKTLYARANGENQDPPPVAVKLVSLTPVDGG